MPKKKSRKSKNHSLLQIDQPKFERMLQLLLWLANNHYYTIEEIAEKSEMSVRTIYRYIDTFRHVGFVIKNENNVYKIDKSSPYLKDISELVHFTDEKAYILKAAIEGIDETNLLKQNLKKKLYSIYNFKAVANIVVKDKYRKNVHKLIEAMEQQQQVRLCGYHSAHSNTISDRVVEPFEFTANYLQCWCWDLEQKKVRLFKTSRISQVELLNQAWTATAQHCKQPIDIFRISSNQLYPIELQLSVRAANLLVEEYPLAEKYLTQEETNRWKLKTEVCGFEGVGRFILELYDEITIVESEELKQYIRKKIVKMQ